ncbi:MAG TPA: MoxR family ATPase [Blastocatellia bacterium]|nr:MoxR family ATPase [Blastocatellia bacterium]
MKYATVFDPKYPLLPPTGKPAAGRDLRDGSFYVFTEPLERDPTVLVVKVALATGRPLLLCGAPGSGKSSLAAFVARTMNWNYFEQVITSRTRAQDLMWSFDAVRRLRDAQARSEVEELTAYIEPRVLWWAFNPVDALRRGRSAPPQPDTPPTEGDEGQRNAMLRGYLHPSVVLLDEIDKADPDVPNDLLVAIGSQRFRVTETDHEVKSELTPLVIITSNNERALPAAFVRRCIVHRLEPPDAVRLVEIANQHFPEQGQQQELFKQLAARVVEMRGNAAERGGPTPSTPEYLDAVRACLQLNIFPGDTPEWRIIQAAVFDKQVEG